MANEQIGRFHAVAVSPETLYGNAVYSGSQAGAFWLPRMEGGVQPTVEYAPVNAAILRREALMGNTPIKNQSDSSIKTYIMERSIGALLYAAFGTYAYAAYSTSAHQQTYSILNTLDLPSYTVAGKDNLQAKRSAGARLNVLTLEFTPDENCLVTAEFLGRKPASATETVSYPAADRLFRPSDISVKFAETSGALGAASAVGVESLTLTFDNKMAAHYDLGSDSPALIAPSEGMEISLAMTIRYNNTTYEGYYEDGTTRAVQVALSNSRTTIGVAGNPSLTFTYEKVLFDEWSNPKGIDELMVQEIGAKAVYDRTESKSVQAVLCTDWKTYRPV